MTREIRDRAGFVLERFSEHLGFQFTDASSDLCPRRSTGLAPTGHVGVIDVVDGPIIEVSLLYSSSPGEYREQVWVNRCIIALADSLDIDFLRWVRTATVGRGRLNSWEAYRRFEAGGVAIRFDPIDIMVLTVHRSQVS